LNDNAGHKWQPIEDLPEDWKKLSSSELASLSIVWSEQSVRLQKSDSIKTFNKKLAREWAIETGIIENLYSIDRGITQILIERGLEASLIPYGTTDRPPEQIIEILRDHENVLEGIFDFVKGDRPLSISYIRALHQELTRNQDTVLAVNGLGRHVSIPLIRGDWKQQPNNPTRQDRSIHEYCPPEHVQAEMDRLVEMHLDHMALSIPPEIEAAWLHHRFTSIHPFQDGNGRVARSLASLIFLRAKWFPLVIHRDHRTKYIDCLEAADNGHLKPLIDLFCAAEKRAFLSALSISETVLREHVPIQQVIAAAAQRLKARFEGRIDEFKRVFLTADELVQFARDRLVETANELEASLRTSPEFHFAKVDGVEKDRAHWFRHQIIKTAQNLGYFADTRTYHGWVRLKIRESTQAEIVVSLHSLGVEFVGIIAASAFIEYRDRSDEGEIDIEGPYVLCMDVFQFSYHEDISTIRPRFDAWLNQVTLTGLDHWRKQI